MALYAVQCNIYLEQYFIGIGEKTEDSCIVNIPDNFKSVRVRRIWKFPHDNTTHPLPHSDPLYISPLRWVLLKRSEPLELEMSK